MSLLLFNAMADTMENPNGTAQWWLRFLLCCQPARAGGRLSRIAASYGHSMDGEPGMWLAPSYLSGQGLSPSHQGVLRRAAQHRDARGQDSRVHPPPLRVVCPKLLPAPCRRHRQVPCPRGPQGHPVILGPSAPAGSILLAASAAEPLLQH